MKSFYKRHKCDQCDSTFKRGLRMDLIVNKIVIRENDMQWDPVDDTEFVAFFCNRDCLLAYIIDNYYIAEGGTYEEVNRAIAAYLTTNTDNEPSSPNSN